MRRVQNLLFQCLLVPIAFWAFPAPASYGQDAPDIITSITKVSGSLVSGGRVLDCKVSPNSSYVVFRAYKDNKDIPELYSADLHSGALVKLNSVLPPEDYVFSYAISPNSQWVVYQTSAPARAGKAIFSVPIGGGSVRTIIHPLLFVDRGTRDFSITPDNASVVFGCDQDTAGQYELYKSPITGTRLFPTPQILPVKLNDGLAVGDYIKEPVIAPNGNFVIYKIQTGGFVWSIWRAPIGGGTNTKVSTDIANYPIKDFLITPDSQKVVYRMFNLSVYSYHRLYSVAATGGTATRLDNPSLADGNIDQYRLSSNGSYVVYTGKQDSVDTLELYSVPTAGPNSQAKKLNGTMVTGGNIECLSSNSYYHFFIAPNSTDVVYCADQAIDGRYNVYRAPISGASTGTQISPIPSGSAQGSYMLVIAPDSSRVFLSGLFAGDTILEAYSVPMGGGTPVNLIPGSVAGNIYVEWIFPSPDSRRALIFVYLNAGQGDRVFTVPAAGGQVWDATVAPPNNSKILIATNAYFTPDSTKAFIIGDLETSGVNELFQIDVSPNSLFLPLVKKD